MSSETLSQSEIDNLLKRGGSAVPAPAAPRVTQDVQVYDFRRPNRVSKEKLRNLEAMYERLVKSLEGWLIGRVRGQVELKLQSIEPFSFGEFIFSLPTPCASYLFDIADSGGQQGVIDIGHEFAYYLVDRFFGGGSGTLTAMDRALTPIERMAVRGVAERIVQQLHDIWSDHVKLELELAGFESFPEILQAVNREDPVLVANIEVRTADMSSLVLVCLPFAVLDKFFASTDAPAHQHDRRLGARARDEPRAHRVVAARDHGGDLGTAPRLPAPAAGARQPARRRHPDHRHPTRRLGGSDRQRPASVHRCRRPRRAAPGRARRSTSTTTTIRSSPRPMRRPAATDTHRFSTPALRLPSAPSLP